MRQHDTHYRTISVRIGAYPHMRFASHLAYLVQCFHDLRKVRSGNCGPWRPLAPHVTR